MTSKAVREAKEWAKKFIHDHPAFANKNTFSEVMPFIDYLNRMGKTLHTRYEAECSYEWADTDAYRKRTEQYEASLLKRATAFGFSVTDDVNEKREGAFIRLQTDPRGWPVELILNGRSTRLGG